MLPLNSILAPGSPKPPRRGSQRFPPPVSWRAVEFRAENFNCTNAGTPALTVNSQFLKDSESRQPAHLPVGV
jgi:hypothetical protein